MTSHTAKAAALAGKIRKKADDALVGLEREMAIMKWSPDFRAIMWGAVADIARQRQLEAEGH